MPYANLSPAQCVLLTVHLASESNIKALHSFTPTRLDALDPELVLRILLTYLPESLEPSEYITYVREVASRLYLDTDREDVEVDTASIKDISDDQAQKRVKKLHLLQILPPGFPPHAPEDLLTRFICHRAYRIDSETGMLGLLPALVEPFIDRNEYMRTWYISVVLPLLRSSLQYYPEYESMPSLAAFEATTGSEGIDTLLAPVSTSTSDTAKSNIARDIKGLVGPWMYGHTERKRRKLDQVEEPRKNSTTSVDQLGEGVRKIALEGVTKEDQTGHDWEYMYKWIVNHAVDDLASITQAIEDWDGPGDVDLGGFDRGGIQYLEEETQIKLERQYAQAAFASCYAAKTDSEETVRQTHAILARLAMLLDFIPPPDLATSVASLPKIERNITKLERSETEPALDPEKLLKPNHALTTPTMEVYMLLQMMVYSAYQFCGLGHQSSLAKVAKLHFNATADDQLEVLRKIIRDLARLGSRKDESRWLADRAKLLWLWNWGIEPDQDDPEHGIGVLGKIPNHVFEEEMLKIFTEANGSDLAIKIYITSDIKPLPAASVERIVLAEAMKAYDSASNSNKTRGGVKKANDLISAFQPHFPNSVGFRQALALISATHAMSFYSLALQHGVPFQPVSIRVSHDPLALISKVLEQNPQSYAKVDDLINIAQNFVSAGLPQENGENPSSEVSPTDLSKQRSDAERRVTFMAIEAALREDDFETAYSYIVNRLTPSGADIEAPKPDQRRSQGHVKQKSRARNEAEDDISWRAAFLAGRYRPAAASPPSVRRLEQRTELLSLALLLAPESALTEILAAWRRCEEEMTSLQLSQQAAEEEFDDRADKRLSGGIPGNFTVQGEQPELILNQKRREVGRMGAVSGKGNDETPLSMFDLTRNAARAFSNNAFPLRNISRSSTEQQRQSLDLDPPSSPTSDQPRVRRRDMVASAVSGGLASGLGWVLGATPVQQQHEQQQLEER